MIVIFTSNLNGAMVQFSIQLLESLTEMGMEAVCLIPDGAIFNVIDCCKSKVFHYNKVKKISRFDKNVRAISNRIMDFNPDLVWFGDNGVLSAEVGNNISNKTDTICTLHDAGGYHPTNNKTIIAKMSQYLKGYHSEEFAKRSKYVLLLSKESKNKFVERYPSLTDKTRILKLGAHVPHVEPYKPTECDGIEEEYFLFFGRIDKYKGIDRLLKAYKKYNNQGRKLIIAGNGTFSNEENMLINSDNRVVKINRYIKDEEMIWLFQNSRCLILPYIEATQSGIIPIAYKYSKPVIVSNIKGLTQVVENGKTGIICNSIEDYINAMELYDDETVLSTMASQARKFFDDNFDWCKNIKTLLDSIGIKK